MVVEIIKEKLDVLFNILSLNAQNNALQRQMVTWRLLWRECVFTPMGLYKFVAPDKLQQWQHLEFTFRMYVCI